MAIAAEAGLFQSAIVEPIAAGTEGSAAWRAEAYVAAESLDVAMRHVAPMPLDRARVLVEQLAAAIDIARAAGFGHGGLHPRDIFLSGDDVRVSGFGIVSALETAGVRPPVRRPYSAPERVAGVTWATPADVFSLAAVTFELLTGSRPTGHGARFGSFEGSPAAGIAGLPEVFAHAMDPDPLHRFATATAFADALARLDAGRGRPAAAAALAGGSSLLDMPAEVPAFADEDDLSGIVAGGTAAGAAKAGRHWDPVDPATDDALFEEAGEGWEAAADAGDDEGVREADGVEAEPEAEVADDSAERADDIVAEREEDEAHWSLTKDEQATEPGAADDLFAPEDEEAAADQLMFDAAEATLGAGTADSRFDDDFDLAGSGETRSVAAGGGLAFGAEDDEAPGEDDGPGDERPGAERWAPPSESERPPAPDGDGAEDDESDADERPEPRPSFGRFTYDPSEAVDADPDPYGRDAGIAAGAIGAGLGLSGAAAPVGGEESPVRRRPFRRFEDDEIASPETASAPPERSRREITPMAMIFLLGLLMGFAAGFSVGERDPGPVTESPETTAAGTGGEAIGSPTPAVDDTERPVPPGGAPEPVEETAGPPPSPAVVTPPAVAAAPPPAPPAARSGRLIVRSSPSGAAVTINGRWSGRTPLTVDDLALGSQNVRVVLDGYETARDEVSLTAAQASRTLTFPLRRVAAPTSPATPPPSQVERPAASTTGVLQVDSRPTGARILIDGTLRGTTPARIPEIAPGSHEIRLELPGHLPWSTTTRIEGGSTTRVAGSLEPIR